MIRLLACATALLALLATPSLAQSEDLSKVPGTVINHIPASVGIYVGSPSIVILPDGTYVASHDEFGPKSAYHGEAITRVFHSTDRGATWKPLSKIGGCLWANLFV